MARVNTKTIHTARHVYLTTMSAANVTNPTFYSKCVTASGPLATSKQKHLVIL